MLWSARAKGEVVGITLKLTKPHLSLVEAVFKSRLELSPRAFSCRDGATLASFVLACLAYFMSPATPSFKSTSHHLKGRYLMAAPVPRGRRSRDKVQVIPMEHVRLGRVTRKFVVSSYVAGCRCDSDGL
jgi:hypothetical protein